VNRSIPSIGRRDFGKGHAYRGINNTTLYVITVFESTALTTPIQGAKERFGADNSRYRFLLNQTKPDIINKLSKRDFLHFLPWILNTVILVILVVTLPDHYLLSVN